MNPSLQRESENLVRSWAQHQGDWLRDYLVAGVEDPRINLQSIFSRHFIIRALTGDRFISLMDQEYRFAAVMNWLIGTNLRDLEQLQEIDHALRRSLDNAEGLPIPGYVLETFSALPAATGTLSIPNYIQQLIAQAPSHDNINMAEWPVLNTFQHLWREALSVGCLNSGQSAETSASGLIVPSVIEPACGSANDYRFLNSFGIAPLINYTGFDLCPTNIENARALFPPVQFEVGNVFEIQAADKAYDLLFVHDLLEHLSLEGITAATAELCRVTRWGMCLGFFNMDEMPAHVVQPLEEYHWNRLSMALIKDLFLAHGFAGQVIHVGTFLRRQLGCEHTHNPNAYTFLLHARR